MALATIGALRVTLGADTAQFEAGMARSQKRLRSLGKSMKRIGAAMSVAFAGAAFAASRSMMKFSAEADKLAKMSRSIGIPVDELSRLKHAAELSGVGIDAFGKSVKRLSANMGEVAAGMGGTAGRAFDQLGISVNNTDGIMKSSIQVMSEVAEKFSAMADGSRKTSLAIALGGQKFADFIPLLNSGAAGMKKLTDEADELGITLNQRTASAAEAFNDSITRLKAVTGGIITKLGDEMLPVLANLGEMLVDASKDSEVMKAAGEGLSLMLKGLVSAAVIVGAAFKALSQIIVTVGSAIKNVAQGEFELAREAILGGIGNIGETAEATAAILERIWSKAAEKQAVAAAQLRAQNKITFDAIQRNTKETSRVIAKTSEKAAKSIEDNFGQSFDGVVTGMAQSLRRGEDVFATFTSAIDRMADRLIDQALSPLEDAMGNMLKGAFSPGPTNITPGAGGGGISAILSGISGLFGGFRATGGPVSAGKAYVVGERGREIFMPGTSGQIVPNGATGGTLRIETSVGIDDSGAFRAYVRKVSGDMAINVVASAAPAIVGQAGQALGRGDFDPSMAVYGAKRQARVR